MKRGQQQLHPPFLIKVKKKMQNTIGIEIKAYINGHWGISMNINRQRISGW